MKFNYRDKKWKKELTKAKQKMTSYFQIRVLVTVTKSNNLNKTLNKLTLNWHNDIADFFPFSMELIPSITTFSWI